MAESATHFTDGDVRTFRAATPREALAAVKKALGPGAVIVGSREVPGGLFRAAEVEILATPERPTLTSFSTPPTSAHPQNEAQRQLRSGAASRAHARFLGNASGAPAPASGGPEHRSLTPRPARERDVAVNGGTVGRAELVTKLIARGLEEELAVDIVDNAMRRPLAMNDPMRALGAVVRGIAPKASAPWVTRGRRRVIAIVGPTGVGKTTTIAKIAARALTSGSTPQRIALVSLDNWRIGAVEQLGRYAEIMGLAAHVVADRAQLASTLAHHENADLVLVDTAGRSPNDTEALARQADLLRDIPDAEIYAAIPASTSEAHISLLLERMGALPLEGIVVTKLDEAVGPARVVSVAYRTALPLALVTDGQRVPEDVHEVTGENLEKWALG